LNEPLANKQRCATRPYQGTIFPTITIFTHSIDETIETTNQDSGSAWAFLVYFAVLFSITFQDLLSLDQTDS